MPEKDFCMNRDGVPLKCFIKLKMELSSMGNFLGGYEDDLLPVLPPPLPERIGRVVRGLRAGSGGVQWNQSSNEVRLFFDESCMLT